LHAYASPALLPKPSQGLLPARAGSPLAGRDLHPLDDEQRFMETSHPPIPFDQQGLVALIYLSAQAKLSNMLHYVSDVPGKPAGKGLPALARGQRRDGGPAWGPWPGTVERHGAAVPSPTLQDTLRMA